MIDRNKYPEDQELTTKEAAVEAGIDRRTVVAWIHRGDLAATRRPGKRGHYRVLWADLYAALHRPAIPKAQEPSGAV